jgi:hypothetical protein
MNNWNDLQTSKLFDMVFTTKIPIEKIVIEKVELYNSCNSLRVDFDLLNQLPDNPPEKWRIAGYNRCRLGLDCNNIKNLNISGNVISDVYDIKITFDLITTKLQLIQNYN